MARSSSLSIRVVEGRALPAKDVSGSSDPYCLVKVDDEVVARTATVWRSLSPFWGEEYTVHLPQDFHHLAFYVLDQDTVGHDDIIGKISLSKEAITADPRGIDSWINLSRVDPDAEVQGEVCLAVQVLDDAGGRCLRCHIRQARDLAPRDISGTSDPFARVFWGSQSSETSIIKKTRFPHWDEVLELRAAPGTVAPLRVELWDWDMVGKNDFLGMGQPGRPAGEGAPDRGPCAALRVLPASGRAARGVGVGACGGGHGQPAGAAGGAELWGLRPRPGHAAGEALPGPWPGRQLPGLRDAPGAGPYRRPQRPLPFQLPGLQIHGAVHEARGHALPARGAAPHHQPGLRGEEVHGAGPLQDGPEPSQDVKYLAISGFLFLRFFAPAILTPKLFDLRDQHADPQTSRSLLLLAKAVQSIGNLGQQLGQGKELWMAPLHPFLLQSVARVRDFLDQLVDVDEEKGSPTRALVPPSETVREGYLLKRREEQGGLTPRFAFKKRYFWLSGDSLAYAKSPEGQARVSLAVRRIRAVERVDEGAFQLPHVMQVVTGDEAGAQRTTYLQCKNVNDLNQWLSALRKASAANPERLAACHPGAFRGGRWTCCLRAERAAAGCSRTHSAVTLGDWSDPLDPDAETQAVYRQLLLGRDQLRMKFLEDLNPDLAPEADTGKDPGTTDRPPPEVLARQRAAAAHLLQVLEDLDRAHEEFLLRL
ncbi:rasGAP-activating-like protein 1 isoform X3 [Dipodomys merriami]|uniref:rasGAP-activating-like protein 1 isoform X3 n=1 Tax=Dipodomys merriami TaxID=94247 RepID=UPI003855FE86